MAKKPLTPKRILIRGTNWIGDTVMSLAAFRELRSLYPEAHLAAYVKEWVAGVLREQGLVDEIITFGNRDSGFGDSKRLRSFDTAVLFQNAFRAALQARMAGIPERIGYNTDGRSILLTRKAVPRIKALNRHQIYYYLDLLYQTGLSGTDYLNEPGFHPDISIRPTTYGLRKAGELLMQEGIRDDNTPLIGINPGAYFGPAKRWLTERYGKLADMLTSRYNAAILVFGSADELPIAQEMAAEMKARPLILTGKTDLETYIALISLSRVFITNDSGPMHIAASLDVPQVAIFGSTDDSATGPRSPRAQVIHKHVECSPCLLRECPLDMRCFTSIEVEEVMEAVRESLAE
jgi:heptosyltransferase-2